MNKIHKVIVKLDNMAKKKPVNITIQTIYIFIPILSLLALYRVEKLRWGILIGILFALTGYGVDYLYGVEDDGEDFNFVFYSDHPDYLLMHIALFVGDVIVFVYLIRKWSREWNNRNDVKLWGDESK